MYLVTSCFWEALTGGLGNCYRFSNKNCSATSTETCYSIKEVKVLKLSKNIFLIFQHPAAEIIC